MPCMRSRLAPTRGFGLNSHPHHILHIQLVAPHSVDIVAAECSWLEAFWHLDDAEVASVAVVYI